MAFNQFSSNHLVRMSAEKFGLKWNDFKKNIRGSFKALGDDIDFCDITLASEGNQQINAHKVILGKYSPFFMEMLQISSIVIL